MCLAADADDDDESDDESDDDDEDDDGDGGDESVVDKLRSAAGATDDAEDDAADDVEGDTDSNTPRSELKYMDAPKGMHPRSFYCHKITVQGLPTGFGCPSRKDLLASTNVQEGFWAEPDKLQEDLDNLKLSGFFKDVKIKARRCAHSIV